MQNVNNYNGDFCNYSIFLSCLWSWTCPGVFGCLNVSLKPAVSLQKLLGAAAACWGAGGFSPIFLSPDFVRLGCGSEGWVPAELGFLVIAALN